MYGLVWMGSCQKGLARPGQGAENCLIRVSYLCQIRCFWALSPAPSSRQPPQNSQQTPATGRLPAGLLREKSRFLPLARLGHGIPGDNFDVRAVVAGALLGCACWRGGKQACRKQGNLRIRQGIPAPYGAAMPRPPNPPGLAAHKRAAGAPAADCNRPGRFISARRPERR